MKKKEYNRHLKRWALGTLRRDMKSSEVAQILTSRGNFFLVAARVFKVAQFRDFVVVLETLAGSSYSLFIYKWSKL